MPLTDDEAIDAVLTPRAPVAPASAPAITARAPSADDAAVEAALSGTTERASQNLAVAARMAPEQAAKVHKMARDAGLSPWAVEGNEALVMQDLTARRNRELIAKNPVLATAIANNPAFADVAFDDMENADKISKAWDKGGFGAAARIARQTADRQQQIIEQQAGASARPVQGDYSTAAKLELLTKSGKSGMEALKSATAGLVGALLPTTSEEDLAVLYKNDPEGLKRVREAPANFLNSIALREAAKSTTTMKGLSPGVQAGYGSMEYASAPGDTAAYLSPTKVLADVIQSAPSTIALMVTAMFTKGAASKAEAQALATGATAEVARKAGIDAAVRAAATVGGVGEGAQAYAQGKYSAQAEVEALPDAVWQRSPQYRALLEQGYSPAAAKLATAARVGEAAGAAGGLSTGLFSVLGGPLLGRVIGEGGRLVPRAAKGFAAEAAMEAPQSGFEQLFSNTAKQRFLDPKQDIMEGVAEATLQGFFVGGASGSLFAGVLGREYDGIKAETSGAALLSTMQQAAESLTLRRDPVAFNAFFQEVAGDSTVFVDREQLLQVFAEAKLDINEKLPSAAAQLNQATPEGIEIPIAELVTNLSGSGIEEQLVQHLRMEPNAMTIAEGNTKADEAKAFIEHTVEQIMGAKERSEQFVSEVKQIEDDVAASLNAVGAYGTGANKTNAKIMGAWYATVADKWGVTPLQIRDGWTAPDGAKYAGWKPQILGAPTAPAQGQDLSQGFSHGKPMVNIGLDIGDVQNALSEQDAIAMLQKFGVTVTDSKVQNLTHDWGKENTLVAHLDRALTPDEMAQLMAATQQEAIPQYADGVGTLYHATPEAAAKWGPFNPEYFRDLNGVSLLDAQKGLTQGTGLKAVDINSPEFKAWFGDSKVVDAEGKPLVVYHATKADFDVFNPNSHFGSKAQAEAIAANLKGKVGKNVIPVYLSAQKLKRVKDVEIRQRWDAEVAKAKKQGYDGLVYDNEFEGGGDSYVVFEPTQIKSAVSNTGAFSNEAPNILAQSQSARTPTSKKGEDSLGPNPLLIDYKKIEDDKNAQNMALAGKYPGVRFKARGTDKRVEEFIQHLTDNLLWLHDQIPAEIRQRSKLWYDGANVIANRWTEKYDISLAQAAAVLAVYSPQKDWFTNVSLAERTLDIVREHQNTPWSDEMAAWFEAKDTATRKAFDKLRKNIEGKALAEISGKAARNAWISAYKAAHDKELPAPKAKWDSGMSLTMDAKKEIEHNKYPKLRALVEGKTLSELPDNYAKAVWLRARDEAHNDRRFRTVTPEGGFTTFVTAGEAAMLEQEAEDTEAESETGAVAAWGSYATIEKALDVLVGGSQAVISGAIGKKHKVRSFYNNIFAPGSALGFVTIDTHAVAAGLLRPLSGNDLEVSQNFGSAGSAKSATTGMEGTYAYYQEAYRRAAEARGLLPREMQSITWEAVRELYTMPFKHKKSNGKKVDELWTEYSKGKRDAESVRSEILKLAGGVEKPAWVGHDSGLHEGGWASSYTGELLGAGVAGRQGAAAARAGTGATGGDSVLAQRTAADQRAVGAVSSPVVGIHFSKAERPVLSSSMFGTGMKAAEAERIAAATDPRIKQRIAFYVNTGNGIVPESDVGTVPHVVELSNLYDADADVLKIWRNNGSDMNSAESAVLDAGFDGYLTRNFGKTGAVVLLGQRNLRVDVATTTDVPEAPSPEIPAAKALAMELSRNPRLVSGQQSIEGWKKDLERIEPETAKLVDWSKFESGKMYYKADLAATLWQGREQWYFSALEVALKAAPAKVFTSGKAVAQWLTANAGKMSVKAAEIEATGITDWLETQGKVTQEQVVEFMAQGGVRLEETVLSEPFDGMEDTAENPAKFASYQLPGGENYREWLLTLPSGGVATEEGLAQERYGKPYAELTVNQAAAIQNSLGETRPGEFRSTHFEQPNIIAHIRTNERTDANGRRVLFIEEIQSDWAQKGRKEGFDGRRFTQAERQEYDRLTERGRAERTDTENARVRELGELAAREGSPTVPSAPFVTDTKAWTALALKRMIAHAVENGFDSVAWTTGEQQAARYDLSKQVDGVTVSRLLDGTYSLTALKDGRPAVSQEATSPAELENIVGKDLASKIVSDAGGHVATTEIFTKTYTGLDLKVGGEGMKGYYDQIVPQVANDVLKKLGGGKVGTVDLGGFPRGTEEATRKISDEQMGFQIAPAMREAVSTQGMPLFAGGPKKGSFSPATFELRLLADADLSTFLHEASHFFLAAYTDMASQPGAPKALVDEVNAILGHLFKTVPGGAVAGGDLAQKVGAGGAAYKAVDVWSRPFRAWFGRSKVVDERGRPLRVYHGTATDVAAFDPSRAGKNYPSTGGQEGLYFTDDSVIAGVYAEQAGYAEDGGEQITPVYLSLQNPLVRQTSGSSPDKYFDYNRTKILAAAKKAGADGIVVRGADRTLYVAFKGEQVKSAISNTGAFQGPNILEQNGEVPAPGPLPEGATPLEIWSKMSLDQQRPYHEAWAEQFEQYAMTGKAPSLELDSAFKTFANWLKKIYISLKTFVATHTGGKLQPDTAAFFDRMLATEEQIRIANEARSYTAMFKNAADAGMSDQKFADYMALSKEQAEDAEAMLRSRSLRDMAWLQRTRTKFIAAKQAEAAEMRKAVRDEVEKELAATPLRRAAKWLKHGEMTAPGGDTIKVLAGNKLQISDVEDIFPEKSLTPRPDISKLGYGQYGMLAKEGLAPDLVAEMFGYRSGEALVRDLLEMKPFKEEVESLTDTRMLEEHSEMLDPDAIAKEADAAIHNDARTRMVATELAALNNKVGSPAALMKAAKAYATQIIETKTSKTLKPWTFAAAETRAGKAALALLRKGKRDEAAEQKRVELVNHTAAKLAYQAEAEITKIIAKFRKIAAYSDKHSSVKSRDFATVQAVRALISQVGIGAKGEKAAAYLELVQKYDPATGLLLKDAIDTFGETDDWQNIKLADLRQLAENVDNLWGFAKATRGFMVGKERLELEDVAGQVVAALRDYAPEGELGKTHAVTEEDKLSIKVSGMKSVVARIEIWAQRVDNTPGIGAVARYLVNTIKSPENDYMVQREAAYADIEARLRKIAPALKPRLIDATEDLGYVFGHGPGKSGVAELLAAMLHTGNPSNKQKLLLGRKGEKTLKDGTKVEMPWGAVRKDGTLDTTQWDKFIKKMQDEGVLTKELYDFVQESWDMFESIKPQMQAANMAVLGKFFGEITAEKFSTPFGEYAGGYVPALTDRDIVHDQDVRELDLEALGGISRSLPAPANGMTKERANAYNKPLALDLGLLPMQMNKALLFAHMAAPVAQVQRLVNTTEVKEALDKAFPGARVHMLMPWLARAATHRTSLLSPEFGPTGQVWTYLRAATGMSRMMGNVSNAVQQYTGLATATGMLEDKKQMIYAAPALLWIGDLRSKVKAMSPYMAQRMATELSAVSGSIHEILLNPSVFQQARKWTFQHGYFLQQWADLHVSPVVWVAAYNSIKSVHPDTTEQDARDYADRIVRLSQGATGPTDISTFEAGHPFAQLLTQFSGWGLGQGQTIYSALATNFRRDVGLPEKYSKATGIVLLMVLVPSMLAELIATGFRGGPDDDDRDGQLIDDWLHQVLLLGPVKFLAGGVPVLGKGIQTALNMWNDKPYDDRLSVAPAVGTIEGVARSPVSVYEALFKDGKPSKAIKDVSEIGTLFGLPTAAAARPISYWADVAAGRVQPTGLWDATRGTITGAASPASKQ